MSKKTVCYGTYDKNKYLDEFETLNEAKQFVVSHINKNQESYYIRTWYVEEEKTWVFDYGSHTNFYFIVDYDVGSDVDELYLQQD